MDIISTRSNEAVSVDVAIKTGLAPDGGLYIPKSLPKFNNLKELRSMSLQEFASTFLSPFLNSFLTDDEIYKLCTDSFNFPLNFKKLNHRENCYLMELFHGPTAAFKDFGAQFLANFLNLEKVKRNEKKLILVATSGDTGGAVASAFHKKSDFNVAIFFPKDKVSLRQKYQLTCWDNNIKSFEVDGSFDDCQSIVKSLMVNYREDFNFGSANSINLGRLLPQAVYHAYTAIHLFHSSSNLIDFIIPTGNLGNALACVWAREMGMPINSITLATNNNATLSDFFQTGTYTSRKSIPTLANAMDVGDPSNFERLQSLYPDILSEELKLSACRVSDDQIKEVINDVYQTEKEIICPHTATGIYAFDKSHSTNISVVAATAHPCKFNEIVSPLIGKPIDLNDAMMQLESRPTCFETVLFDVPVIAEKLANWYR